MTTLSSVLYFDYFHKHGGLKLFTTLHIMMAVKNFCHEIIIVSASCYNCALDSLQLTDFISDGWLGEKVDHLLQQIFHQNQLLSFNINFTIPDINLRILCIIFKITLIIDVDFSTLIFHIS